MSISQQLSEKRSLTAKDVLLVEKLGIEGRVDFFARRVQCFDEVFCLEDSEGLFVAEGRQGNGLLPAWATSEQAIRALFSEAAVSWQDCAVVRVELARFKELLVQARDLADEILVGPAPESPGTEVPAAVLLSALQ